MWAATLGEGIVVLADIRPQPEAARQRSARALTASGGSPDAMPRWTDPVEKGNDLNGTYLTCDRLRTHDKDDA